MKALIFILALGVSTLAMAESSAPAPAAKPDHRAIHQAMKACAEENGLKRPEPGTPPSEEDRAKMEACLKSKGIDHMPPPPHHGRGGHRPPAPPAAADAPAE
jgi:hypothetical protein